jgi:hypothetical protein
MVNCCLFCVIFLMQMIFAQEVIPVPRQIVEELRRDQNWGPALSLKADGTADNLVAIPIDLNGDGKPELIVHGIGGEICGAQNCAHWVYRQTPDGYQLLLDADVVQHIELQKTKSHGYYDLMTFEHSSAFESAATLYKFDGRRYQQKGCFWQTYEYPDKSGVIREWERPRITPVKCER